MALTVLSDDPRFQWLRAFFLLVPVAAIVWFAVRGDIDGQRIAAVFVFFIAAMVFWADLRAGRASRSRCSPISSRATSCSAGRSPPPGSSR